MVNCKARQDTFVIYYVHLKQIYLDIKIYFIKSDCEVNGKGNPWIKFWRSTALKP